MPEGKNAGNLFLETLDWICNKLQSLHIPYMVTGGSAVGFWGHIRTTMDIDMVIQMQISQVDTFLAAVKEEAYADYINKWIDILNIRGEFKKLNL